MKESFRCFGLVFYMEDMKVLFSNNVMYDIEDRKGRLGIIMTGDRVWHEFRNEIQEMYKEYIVESILLEDL